VRWRSRCRRGGHVGGGGGGEEAVEGRGVVIKV
jgi:hypothetical protein